MKSRVFSLTWLFAVGCATSEAPPPVQPEAPAPAPSATAVTSASATAPTTPPPPTPEEQARAEEQRLLQQDMAKLEQDNAAELARITPEIRAGAQKLAEKPANGIKTAVKNAAESPHRRPGHAARDAERHPGETLSFLGVQPSHTVLEYGPGEGWYTELLAPALAKRGKLYVTLTDPNGPATERSTFYGKRTQLQLDSLPEAYGKVERVVVDSKAPKLSIPDGTLDVVLLFRGAHGMVNNGTLDAWLAEFHRALEPRGILGIEQHRAAAGADPTTSAKSGYLPETFVIEQVQKAGFKLAAKSELNANPKDTRDHANGVWSLPPTLRGGDVDRDKYTAIGESDRMTLKFIKTERPKVDAAPAPTAAMTAPAAPSATAPQAGGMSGTPKAPATAGGPATTPATAAATPATAGLATPAATPGAANPATTAPANVAK